MVQTHPGMLEIPEQFCCLVSLLWQSISTYWEQRFESFLYLPRSPQSPRTVRLLVKVYRCTASAEYFVITSCLLCLVIVLVEVRRLQALEENIYLDIKCSWNLQWFTSNHLLVLLMDLNTAFSFSFSHCQYLSFISSASHNYPPLNAIRIVPRQLNFKWDCNSSIWALFH